MEPLDKKKKNLKNKFVGYTCFISYLINLALMTHSEEQFRKYVIYCRC